MGEWNGFVPKLKVYPRLGKIYIQDELDAVPAMDKLTDALETGLMTPVMVEATSSRFVDVYCQGQQEEEWTLYAVAFLLSWNSYASF